MKKQTIYDANGEEWIYDGERVYHAGAEEEFKRDGIPVEENGYYASSLEEAMLIIWNYYGEED